MHVYEATKRKVYKVKAGVALDTLRSKYPDKIFIKVRKPGLKTLEEWTYDSGCETVKCGCWVEPDGHCRHGMPSWLLALGLI